MTRHIPGLHATRQDCEGLFEGLFLVRVDRAFYRWRPQKPFLSLRLVVLEPETLKGRFITGRLYCTDRALWKLNWFLRDFAYDPELLSRDQVDETLNGRSYQNLEAFAPEAEWDELWCETVGRKQEEGSGDDL